MATEAGKNDSIITLGLDLAEETEQSAAIIAEEIGVELIGEGTEPAPDATEAELQEAREIAEEVRQREAAEQERARERDGMER